jgi:glycosyltransferase involved in cell wall biosynthesis
MLETLTRTKKLVAGNKIDNIIFAGFVPDGELDVIYKESTLYVFPSLYEGFGIPPLEAMARGVPVASSDHECMREVLGDSAYYFDAHDPGNISQAVLKMLGDKEILEKLKNKGFEQVKKYSWQKMAEETLQIYQNSKFKNQNDPLRQSYSEASKSKFKKNK